MSRLRKCAFIPVEDRLFYPEGTHIAINSFRRFHPDIDLIIFRQDIIDKLFKDNPGVNWYSAKPFFAQLLEDKYDLICNLDADHIILDRLSLIFDEVDYDIAAPTNFNDYENASFANITEKMYVQAGMVASTNKSFWKIWRDANSQAMKYLRKENDILNLVWYNDGLVSKMDRKILDEQKDYYGCKSLGREPQFTIKDGKTYCRGEQVVAYHFARGGQFPKLDIQNMPLQDDVKANWQQIATYGQTVKITNL